MNLTYFDSKTEKYRIKSRYKWGGWCLLVGIVLGFALGLMFQ